MDKSAEAMSALRRAVTQCLLVGIDSDDIKSQVEDYIEENED